MQRFSPNSSPAGLSWPNQPDFEDAHDLPVFVKSELTSSPDHRLLRLPSPAVPATSTSTSFATQGAILPINRPTTTSSARQDVLPPVNFSASSTTAIRTSGHQSPLETQVSSSTPTSQHVVTNNNKRLRTTNQVFASSSDLAAHYGIPQILPPPPTTSAHRTASTPAPARAPSTPFIDFDALKNSYLNMLAKNPEDNSTMSVGPTASPAPAPAPTAGATAQSASLGMEAKEFQDLVEYFGMAEKFSPIVSLTHTAVNTASPEFKDAPVFESDLEMMNQFLTSPLPELLHDFDSPEETPYHDFLTTPVIPSNDDFDINMPIFPDYEPVEQVKPPPAVPSLDTDGMFTISPGTPMLDTPSLPMQHSPLVTSTQLPSTTPATNAARRRGAATGTRKGITPESLVPLDAPTQPRKYVTPSATSRKELPAVFARKRARSQALGDEEDELDADHQPPGPNASEREQIEWKRRQNTLAARKSRKRKLQHQQELEDNVRALTRDRDVWKTRALTFRQLLVSHGIPFNEFQD